MNVYTVTEVRKFAEGREAEEACCVIGIRTCNRSILSPVSAPLGHATPRYAPLRKFSGFLDNNTMRQTAPLAFSGGGVYLDYIDSRGKK